MTKGDRQRCSARRLTAVALCWLGCLLAGSAAIAGQARTRKKSCCRRTTFVREEIFGNKHSARLVEEARRYDPGRVPKERADRGKAVALYEEAMALQPGAKINAALALRIAQLYAYYEDRSKGALAEPARAVPWWQRAVEASNPRQFLWVEAHMGLGSSRFLVGDRAGAAETFRAVLCADPEGMDLPDWKVWPEGNSERDLAVLKEAHDCTRERTEKARMKAVDHIRYVLIRHDGAAAATALLEVTKAYEGTPVGDRARQLLVEALESPSSSIYRYRGLPTALGKELARLEESVKGGGVGSGAAPHEADASSAMAASGAPTAGRERRGRPPDAVVPPREGRGGGEPAPSRSGSGCATMVALAVALAVAVVALAAFVFLRRAAVVRRVP